MSTTLITGGTVVSATGRAPADVLVDGEKIVAVLAPGSELLGTNLAASVDTVVDAKGEARRIRENKVLGKPITTNVTPTIKRK